MTVDARADRLHSKVEIDASGCWVWQGRVRSRVKQLPCSGVLLTLMQPCISSSSLRQIDRPRPVPPNSRVVEESAWVKG